MANNYAQAAFTYPLSKDELKAVDDAFSLALIIGEDKEEKWANRDDPDFELDPRAPKTYVPGTEAFAEALAEAMWDDDALCIRLGFNLDFEANYQGQPALYFYYDEYFEAEPAAIFLSVVMRALKHKHRFGFEVAYTCSKPRPWEFGGCAWFVCAGDYDCVSTHSLIERYQWGCWGNLRHGLRGRASSIGWKFRRFARIHFPQLFASYQSLRS